MWKEYFLKKKAMYILYFKSYEYDCQVMIIN